MIGSGRVLLYTLLMMGTTIYIFAVVFVVLITDNNDTKNHPLVLEYFQTVPEARDRTVNMVEFQVTMIYCKSYISPVGPGSNKVSLFLSVASLHMRAELCHWTHGTARIMIKDHVL